MSDPSMLWIILPLGWVTLGLMTALVISDDSQRVHSDDVAAGLFFWPLLWLKGIVILFCWIIIELVDLAVIGWKRIWR